MPASDESAARRRRSEQVAKISHKLHALCWVVAGAVTYVASDIGTVLLSSPAVDRIFLALGGVAAGVVLSVYFYLAIYLTYIVRIRLDWSIYAPGMIPLATASGLLAALRQETIINIDAPLIEVAPRLCSSRACMCITSPNTK
jgi:hypothetical protein